MKKKQSPNPKKRKMKTKFKMQHFFDYHEVSDEALGIGCFPVSKAGCCKYFCITYKGTRPRLKQVYERLLKHITVGDFLHYRTRENIGFSPEDVRSELKLHGIR